MRKTSRKPSIENQTHKQLINYCADGINIIRQYNLLIGKDSDKKIHSIRDKMNKLPDYAIQSEVVPDLIDLASTLEKGIEGYKISFPEITERPEIKSKLSALSNLEGKYKIRSSEDKPSEESYLLELLEISETSSRKNDSVYESLKKLNNLTKRNPDLFKKYHKQTAQLENRLVLKEEESKYRSSH